jgi:DNA (cytosine-5)-methyltransferase 1
VGALCDFLAEARESYMRLLPPVKYVVDDIRAVSDFPAAEIVMGGYPCQSFSLGGNRNPGIDGRTELYMEFARVVDTVEPLYFIAENVSGLKSLDSGRWLRDQVQLFERVGTHGYNVSWAVISAERYGVPQRRRRVFIVGVRRDTSMHYWFPPPTHAPVREAARTGLVPFASHGDAIAGLPLWPTGDFYERPHDPEGHWSWYYMSRNRKAPWDGPSFTVVANFRHVTLHPASPTMNLTWSNLADGWKQRWDFSSEYEHVIGHPERPVLTEPRRLSWRETSLIQTFPSSFEPVGDLARKFELIGNAVPPRLAEVIVRRLVDGSGLKATPAPSSAQGVVVNPEQLPLAV